MKNDIFIFDSIGSDPEFFLTDENGKYVSGALVTTGGKRKPEKLDKLGFNIFTDNLAVEGNIPPASTFDKFNNNMLKLIDYIGERAEQKNLSVAHVGQAEFSTEDCNSIQGQEFACSASLYAWQGIYYKTFDAVSINACRTTDFSRDRMRTAGFHIHIGYHVENKTFTDPLVYDLLVAKIFDLFVSLPTLEIQNKETFREENFGLLGNFRSKRYGVECRSLSGYFTHPTYYKWLWTQIQHMFEYINSLSKDELTELLELHIFDAPNKAMVKQEFEKFSPETPDMIHHFSNLININTYAI
jgi:hypothetical protein